MSVPQSAHSAVKKKLVALHMIINPPTTPNHFRHPFSLSDVHTTTPNRPSQTSSMIPTTMNALIFMALACLARRNRR